MALLFINRSSTPSEKILEPNNHTNDKLKKDIRAIREIWGVGEYEERLVGTVEQMKESNFKSVKIAAKVLPRVQIYLPNLLQFYKY
jgi:hypothetical protein